MKYQFKEKRIKQETGEVTEEKEGITEMMEITVFRTWKMKRDISVSDKCKKDERM